MSPKKVAGAAKKAAPAKKQVATAKEVAPKRGTARAAPKASARAEAVLAGLRKQHPDAHCELVHESAWTLLVATVLSAQTTDKLVNKVTPDLFRTWPTPRDLAAADPPVVAEFLHSRGMGFHNVKSKSIVGLAKAVVERHGGQVPGTMAELVQLPGVGRKTANLILGECFGGGEGVVVDTHVLRLSQRLGLSTSTKPELTEKDLAKLYPKELWMVVSHTLIFHGRRVCLAVKPACASCGVAELCPSAFDAVNVGRK